jgi:AAA+ ATPase superfamily predicted ATPase
MRKLEKPQANLKNQISLIFGRKGSGKTTLAMRLISESERPHLFISDFLSEYGHLGVIVTSPGELLKSMTRTDKATYVCQRFSESEFNQLCEIVYTVGNCLFVIEEVDMVCSPMKISKPFAGLIRYGRHENVDIVAISRRPFDVNRLLTSQADVVYSYRFAEPRDIDYLKALTGCNAEDVTNLEKYHYYEKSMSD